MNRSNGIIGVLTGLNFGLLLHFLWIVMVYNAWPLAFLHWQSHTEGRETILTIPRMGWEFGILAAGLLGALFPLICPIAGYWSERHWFNPLRIKNRILVFLGVVGGLLLNANFYGLMFLLALEN